ncbi:hypothetical protein TthSNM11_17670 [Thermus thermophilus]|nr:hypothetical protein TthSNM11_17670 [Thermus thermophilus]
MPWVWGRREEGVKVYAGYAGGASFELRVFLRERPGVWRDLGCYRVEGWRYALLEEEGRWVYWFTLAPGGCEEAP